MQKILEVMKEHCGLNEESVFMDIGSGLGKPCLHASLFPGVHRAMGVEIEPLRHQLALANLNRAMLEPFGDPAIKRPCVVFRSQDIMYVGDLFPFTHIFQFDVAFPQYTMCHIAELFNRSSSTRYFVCFHKPSFVIDICDFHVQPIASISTRMTGSSEQHTGFVYARPELLSQAERDQWKAYREQQKTKKLRIVAERKLASAAAAAVAAAGQKKTARSVADDSDLSDYEWDTSCSESDENEKFDLQAIKFQKRGRKEQKQVTLVDSKFGHRTGTVAASKFAAAPETITMKETKEDRDKRKAEELEQKQKYVTDTLAGRKKRNEIRRQWQVRVACPVGASCLGRALTSWLVGAVRCAEYAA